MSCSFKPGGAAPRRWGGLRAAAAYLAPAISARADHGGQV